MRSADVTHVSTTVDTRLNERQMRELASLTPDEQRLVYEVAKGTAPDGVVTATHLRSLVNVLSDIARVDAVDDGTGVMVPWHSAPPERKLALLQANLAEETFERLQRQRLHGRTKGSGPTRGPIQRGPWPLTDAEKSVVREALLAWTISHDLR